MTDLSIQYNFPGGSVGAGTNGVTLSAGGMGGAGVIGGAHITTEIAPDGTVTSSETYDVGLGFGLRGVGLVGVSTAIGDGENDITVHTGTLSATASGFDLPPASASEETIFGNTAGIFKVNNYTGVTTDLVNGTVYGDEDYSSEDSAIDAGYGDENGEFDGGTSESDNAISSKMDSDYGATQRSFEQAMEAMSKMGKTTSYEQYACSY